MRRARARRGAHVVLLQVAALAACDADRSAPPPAATTPSAAPPVAASASASAKRAPARASAEPADRLDLQRFRLTTGVENKEPVDELTTAAAGQRVYAHAAIRNRTGAAQRVSLRFLVDHEERTTVDLKVDPSWSWRTWGYVTLRAGDEKATLTVELHDAKGELLAERSIPVDARSIAKKN